MPPTSTIRLGRSYYPSKQFASASADIDPHEWTSTIAPGQMVVFGPGGVGGEWVATPNPYEEEGVQYVPSGYTYRNVVLLNVSDPYEENFLWFGKSAHDVRQGPRRALVTPRGPCYSQGEYDQFIAYNFSEIDVTLGTQWDHAGTPSSTNAGHPGHGHVSLDVSQFLTGERVVIHPAWRRPRVVTAVHLYTKSGVPTAGASLELKLNGLGTGVTVPLSPLAPNTFGNTPIPDPIELTSSSNLQVILSGPAQPEGTDLIVELEYEFV